MDEKISLKALEDYSDDYASKVTASFFLSKEKITGPEIMKVCDIHQINLFVIRELLHTWKLETNKLRSPFFDYTAPPVADALVKFLNLLSNHISISRENFQPLLKKAVSQCLYLIFAPYDFYSEILDRGTGGNLKGEELKNEVRYVKVNRVPLEKLLQTLDDKKLSSISGNEAFAMLDHILEEVNFTPEDVEIYLVEFSKVMPLTLDKFYEKKGVPPEIATRVESVKAELVNAEARISAPLPPAEIVNDTVKPVTAQTTLYDQLAKPVQSTLAENFQKKKKIKDTLTINQKFMFTKILFNGDFELFSAAIERLDDLDNLTQAKSYMTNNYAEWNPEGEEYQEFMEIVEKRFA